MVERANFLFFFPTTERFQILFSSFSLRLLQTVADYNSDFLKTIIQSVLKSKGFFLNDYGFLLL